MKSERLHNMIVKNYSENHKKEWNRLSKKGGSMEFISTVHYLEKYLPKKGLVLDLGSGPGRYSVWLAEHGYDVVAVDPVHKNIKSLIARMRARGLGKKLKGAHVGSAQNLGMLKGSSFDAVVCLGGPISHIMSPIQRKKAASEIIRVAKPRARIFVSVMGRLSVFGGTVRSFQGDLDSTFIDKWADTGDYPGGYGFTPFHGFKPDELETLFGNKITINAKTALEGYTAYTTRKEIVRLMRNKRRWNKFLRIHFHISEEPETLGVSSHYMMVGMKR